MKNILKYIIAITLLILTVNISIAQLHIVVGTQDESSGNDASPYTNYYRSYRVQMLYTAAEIQDALDDAGVPYGSPRDIVGLSWDIVSNHAMNELPNYTIYMGHTDSISLDWHSYEATDEVKSAFTYDPAGTGWQYIEFDSNFEWDGVSNIIIDVCWSSSYSSVGAATYMYDDGSGEYRMLYKRSSFSSMCGSYLNSGNFSNPDLKARVRFAFECDPITVSVTPVSDLCNTSTLANLTGNNPESGHTGAWSIVSGEGTFTNASAYNSQVTNVGQGENVYRWTVTKTADGCAEYEDLTVTNNTPTTANAGSDGSSCDGSYTLNGNDPSIGIGQWTTSSSAVISDDALYNSEVTGLSGSDAGTENTFTWTITNNGCSTSDDVVVTYYHPAIASVVTSPLENCYNSETLTLNGNDPTALTPEATGQWTLISGSGTFTDNTLYNTTVTNVGTPTNTYRWTLSRNGCISSANVVVNNLSPSAANAGTSQIISSPNTTLQANTPNQGTGTWSVDPPGPIIDDVNDPNSTVSNITENITYTFTWTISHGGCDDTSDDITVNRLPGLVGMVLKEDLTNNGTFDQSGEEEYFTMNGTSKQINGGTTTTNTYTNAKVSILGTISFDGEIDNGKFDKTVVSSIGEFTIASGRTFKNHDFENYNELTMVNTSVFENSGDWTNADVVDAQAGSKVLFNGTEVQAIDAGGSNFYNVEIDNTDATEVGLSLGSELVVANTLTMTQGNVTTTDDYSITIGTGTANTGSLSYTDGIVYGKMKRWFGTSTNSGESSGLFPIGHTSATENYLPVIIEYSSAPATGGSLTGFVVHDIMGFLEVPATISTVGSCPEFDITSLSWESFWRFNADGISGGEYDITLNPNGFQVITELCMLTALKRADADSDWLSVGTHVEPSGTIDAPIVKRTGVDSGFSDWGLAGGNPNMLPIVLKEFNVNCEQDYVAVKWTTASESNNEFFTIEKSYDAVNFFPINNIQAAGFSNTPNYYQIQDKLELNKDVYYRLVQTDYDGNSKIFETKALNCENLNNGFYVTPNPFNDIVKIVSDFDTDVSIEVFDVSGAIIYKDFTNIFGETTINLEYLNPGVYFLRIIDNHYNHYNFKLVKER